MTSNLENFKRALKAKNYGKINEALRLMPNGPWPDEFIYEFEGWNDFIEIKVKNWSPLVEAALAGDLKAINYIYFNFRDLNLFNLALQTMQECLQHKANNQCDTPEQTLKFANSLLLTTRERHFPQSKLSYAKQEKDAVLDRLREEINSLDSTAELLEYYRKNVTKEYLNYRRNPRFDRVRSFFFCSEPDYTKSKVKFIELMQERGLELTRNALDDQDAEGMVSKSQIAQQLIQSELFDSAHYKRGVELKEPRNILDRFLRNESESVDNDTCVASAPTLT